MRCSAKSPSQWDKTLNAVQVKTLPDRALDIMLNRWLVYQTLSCRVWARTGFYRGQRRLQWLPRSVAGCDGAMRISRPENRPRASCCARLRGNSSEGDVQHWWLPESGRGIRTRVSDDCGWLAYVVAHYVQTTGDDAVLEEMVPFLEGPMLREDEHDCRLFQPKTSLTRRANLFDHCALALDREPEDWSTRIAADGFRRLE